MADGARGGGAGERRVVTALFCDIVGSTSLAESMDPEDWSDLVNQTVHVMAGAIERYGGTVAQFAGDSVLALFGAPVAHEDDPYRAVAAGMGIVEAVGDLRVHALTELHVRVGISTGLAVTGDIDAGQLNVYSALGDMPNVAARLQSLAGPDEVVISADTYALVSNDVEARDLGTTALKGRDEAVRVYAVEAVRGWEERRRGVRGLASPMVGRDSELDALDELVSAAAVGTGRVAAVLGEPGVGKSRLVEELARRVGDLPGAIWAIGRCAPYDDEPYHLLASLIRSLAGVSASHLPAVTEKAVRALAETSAADGAVEPLLQLLGLEGGLDEASPEEVTASFSGAVLDVVAGLARTRTPIVLVCEDVHWADASSVELMSGLLGRLRSTPTLLLLVMRPDRGSDGWRLLAQARLEVAEALTEIELRPLAEDHSRQMVGHLLEIESLPERIRRMLLDKAEGNPFFLEELVRMLIERGLLEERGDRWVATAEVERLDVPGTLQGLLASRIDLLPPEIRRAGRIAAVIGRQFPARLLEAIHPAPEGAGRTTLHPHLAALEAHGIIRLAATHPEVEFAFRHALIGDVMYDGLLRRERRELHRRVAAALEDLYTDRLEELAATLARHHREAGEAHAAFRHLMVAARSALGQGARVVAHGYYSEALRLAPADIDPGERVDAVIGQARSGMTFVPSSEMIAALEEAIPTAEAGGDPDRLAALYAQLLQERNMQGESYLSDPYRAQLDAAYALVPRLADAGTRALLHGMMGLAHRSADEYSESVGPLEQAVDALEATGRLAEASFHAAMLADSHATVGSFAEAEAVIVRSEQLAEQSGDANAIADSALIRGRIAAEKGELGEALEHTRRGLEAAEAAGNTFCTLAGNFMVADQQLRIGEVEDAISHLERSTGLAQYCNAGGYEALGQAWLAAARARLGDLDAREFDQPLEAAVGSGTRSGEALVRLHRAIAMAGAGRVEEAFDDFERAIGLFRGYGGKPNLARAHHAYGQALQAAGQTPASEQHLREAEAIFTELSIRPDPAPASRGGG